MYIKEQNSTILTEWKDTEINRKKAENWNLEIYTGDKELGFDGFYYVKGSAPQPPILNYAEKRAAEYPAIGEQLDLIYWDKVNNTDTWQRTIAAVKEKYPKEAKNAESTPDSNSGLHNV